MGEQDSQPGVMATVTLDPQGSAPMEELVGFLRQTLDPEQAAIAAYNSPRQLVIAGAAAEIDRLLVLLRDPGAPMGVSTRLMPGVQCAFHSPLMREAARQFATQAAPLLAAIEKAHDAASPHPAVISSVTAQPVRIKELRSILVRQIEAPVDWWGAIRHARDRLGITEWVPLGPGSVMKTLLADCIP